jgi:crotonobetainyl-CoA:carnitine CoA-transferase CaiB-like acyl-CoA transferase
MSATPVEYRLGPPRIGEHTEEVLRELLALQDADLQRLAAGGAIAIAPAVAPLG